MKFRFTIPVICGFLAFSGVADAKGKASRKPSDYNDCLDEIYVVANAISNVSLRQNVTFTKETADGNYLWHITGFFGGQTYAWDVSINEICLVVDVKMVR